MSSSESSCTYKDMVREYESTKESDMWAAYHIYDDNICNTFKIPTLPIALVDTMYINTPTDTVSGPFTDAPVENNDKAETPMIEIPTLDQPDMDDLLMEPLLHTLDEIKETLGRMVTEKTDVMFVSASVYGIKHLVYKIPACLLCIKDESMKLCFPKRIVNKIVSDCCDRGIECKASPGRSSDIYHCVDIPVEMRDKCKSMYAESPHPAIASMVTPIYGHGFREYTKISMTVAMYLSPNRGSVSPGSFGDNIRNQEKRSIQVLILDVE